MTVRVTFSWTRLPSCSSKPTIWEALATKLGREPTQAEAADEVRRILEECTIKAAGEGKLRHQRGLI